MDEHRPARLMTAQEVAEYLRVSEATLSRWRSGAINGGPPWINLNGIARYRVEDLEAWLTERTGP